MSECPEMVVAGEAASRQEVLDLVQLSMKLMVLSMYSKEQYVIRSLRDGASAYLTKASAPDELVQAIWTVAKGKRYIFHASDAMAVTREKRAASHDYAPVLGISPVGDTEEREVEGMGGLAISCKSLCRPSVH